MQFYDLNPPRQFSVGEETWRAGVLSAVMHGSNQFFAVVRKEGTGLEQYVLKPTELEGVTVTNVELRAEPPRAGARLDTLPSAIREHLAIALEAAVKREGKTVDPELVSAVKEGRDLKAERESEPEFRRLTRNADHDLESAYILRDSLREEINTALDEGRDGDAKQAMEQLGAVKKDIAGYWNPHKPRPAVTQPLGEKEEAELRELEKMSVEDLTREAAGEALAHYSKEAAEAQNRGDTEAYEAALAKIEQYSEAPATPGEAAQDAPVRRGVEKGHSDGGYGAQILDGRRVRAEQKARGETPPLP